MPVLQACWSPCWCYSNVKHGTIVVGIYTLVMCIAGILYTAWILTDGPTSEVYSPFFESDAKYTQNIAASILLLYFILFIIFSVLLIWGTKRNNRGMLLPFMVWICILILYMTALGIWFIARYYTYPISVLSAILTWLFTAIEIYCFLCVLSQYQILKSYQSNVRVLYP